VQRCHRIHVHRLARREPACGQGDEEQYHLACSADHGHTRRPASARHEIFIVAIGSPLIL
jgi:hypothetical protein